MTTETLFILHQINLEEKAYEATLVSIYSTRALAIAAYCRSIEGYNGDMDPLDEYWVHPLATAEELEADGFVELLGGSVRWDLTEYLIDSDQTV